MELTKEIRECANNSVLCWLATVSEEGIPNVSPKEIFACFGTNEIIVANIASPQTVNNIRQNENVSISFIDILVQKGFQVKGKAEIIEKPDRDFLEREKVLIIMTEGKFPFSTIIKIRVREAKPIIAPKYVLYPETTEAEQIENAKRSYGILSQPK